MSPLGSYNQAVTGLRELCNLASDNGDKKMVQQMEAIIGQLKDNFKAYVKRQESKLAEAYKKLTH